MVFDYQYSEVTDFRLCSYQKKEIENNKLILAIKDSLPIKNYLKSTLLFFTFVLPYY